MGQNKNKQLKQIESWFRKLNENINVRFDDTNKRLENRFTALLTVCTNLRKNVSKIQKDIEAIWKELESIKNSLKGHSQKTNQHEARILAVELALQELERRVAQYH